MSNILNKVSNIGDPLPTWNAELYLDKKGATSTQKGGYLKDLYRFNPVEFGIMPSSIDGGEPDQFLALSIAHRTLADAGAAYVDKDFDHQDTGVIIGHSPYYHRGQVNVSQHHVFVEQTRELIHAMIPNLTEAQDAELERLLKDQLPAFNADISPGLVPNVLTGRIANRLNLRGPNYMVDAACASSLLAIGSAIDELRAGRSRMMLAGGVNASLPPEVAIIFTQLGALSNRGTVRPFSKQADGTLLGEGLGMVAMKRESDAVADGDKIYALIRGVGRTRSWPAYAQRCGRSACHEADVSGYRHRSCESLFDRSTWDRDQAWRPNRSRCHGRSFWPADRRRRAYWRRIS
jgi:acyl transferase domain-containing protein